MIPAEEATSSSEKARKVKKKREKESNGEERNWFEIATMEGHELRNATMPGGASS